MPAAPFLLVGGDSEIGAATAMWLHAHGHAVAATTRRRERVGPDRPFLDLGLPFGDWQPPPGIRAVCLCAAVARIADCARDPEGSARVNVAGTLALADCLLGRGIEVLFLSSDKVFDGSRPLVSADAPTCPVSQYGRQKAAVEAALRERMREGAAVAILRLAKVVAPRMALVRQWHAGLAAGRSVRAFYDMMLAPVPVMTVAAAIGQLLAEPARGIFQLSGPRDVAYSDVALRLAGRIGAGPHLVEEVSADSAGLPPGSTARHTTLDSTALRARFGIAVPDAWTVIDDVLDTCRGPEEAEQTEIGRGSEGQDWAGGVVA
jgi:dTDP-4-dehydrorhamnose reductase